MKARIKGEKEWKDYKEVFDCNNVLLGLETLGYTISEEEYCKRLGIEYYPESPFNNDCGHYLSAILPLECFDLVEDEKRLMNQAAIAAMQGILSCDAKFSRFSRMDEVVSTAVACADALVKELGKKEE